MPRFLLFTFIALWSSLLMGQDCDSPTQLCYQEFNNVVMDSTSNGPINGQSNSCFEANSASMFVIETVSAGDFEVVVNSILCDSLSNAAYGDSLEVLLFSSADPCDATSYTELDCALGLGNLSLETTADSSGQIFHVLVSGQLGTSFPAQCGYNIQTQGVAVENSLNVTPFYTINQGESVILESSGAEEYLWSPSQTLDFDTAANPLAFPLVTTTYMLETQIGSCTQTFEVIVEVIPGIQPTNLFTPNGDTYNDSWRIFSIEQFPNADVKVFSRWGQQVFRSTGYGPEKEWDGTNGGSRLPEGTYYYVIDLNLSGTETEPITGSVAITY